MLNLLASIAFVIAAVLACTTRYARWWPVLACAGLALLAYAHGVHLNLD